MVGQGGGVIIMACFQRKVCGDSKCLIEGPQCLTAFPRNRQRRDGHHPYCKACCLRRAHEGRANRRTRLAERRVRAAAQMKRGSPVAVKMRPKLTVHDRVWKAISEGRARTQQQIKRMARVRTDELGESLAELIINRGWVKSDLIQGGTVRIYFPALRLIPTSRVFQRLV